SYYSRLSSSCAWCCIFFFSSRRRHTRFSRDWSSDVCSSDLKLNEYEKDSLAKQYDQIADYFLQPSELYRNYKDSALMVQPNNTKIGRASLGKECRLWWWPYH